MRDQESDRAGKTDQAPQPLGKACVTCGATKTPLWRCNVDGQKSLCNRCGVRLYREQKRVQSTNEEVSAKDDDKDDSSSCTYVTSNCCSGGDSRPRSPAKRKRQAEQPVSQEDEVLCWTSPQPGHVVGMPCSPGALQRPALLADQSSPLKRMRSRDLSPPSCSSDDSAVLMPPPPAQPAMAPIIAQAQKALKRAWPTLVSGHLGHLWEAGLDPLDPLFLDNIIDPAVYLEPQDSQLLFNACATIGADYFAIF